MKISHLILTGFLVIVLLFSFTTYLNNNYSKLVDDDPLITERTTGIIQMSDRFQYNFLMMVSSLRGYLLTDNELFLQAYNSAGEDNRKILKELSALVPVGTEQQLLLNDIKVSQEYWVDDFVVPLLDAKRVSSGSDRGAFKVNGLYQKKILDELERDVEKTMKNKFAQFTKLATSSHSGSGDIGQRAESMLGVRFYLTSLFILSGTLIAFFLANYVSSLIMKMVGVANAIGSGNYKVILDRDEQSELAELSKALTTIAKVLDSNSILLKKQKEDFEHFTYVISQDIRAPLHAIDSIVTRIEQDPSIELSERKKESLTLIKDRIVRANGILNGIVAYTKASKEQQPRKHLHVRELIDEVMEYQVQPRLGITLIVSGDLPLLLTERQPLLLVFTNLIRNAFQHHDRQHGEVKVYCKSVGNFYEFTIEDDGPGISKSEQEKIFSVFHVATNRDTSENTGIGLAIVKKILDDRNLKIRILSELGKGSAFLFTWPK